MRLPDHKKFLGRLFKDIDGATMRLGPGAREGGEVEFKESFDWRNRHDYGKTIASFANKRGGYLIFGVADKPRMLRGLVDTRFGDLDDARISEYLVTTFAPEIEYEKFEEYVLTDKRIGVIFVYPGKHIPIVAKQTNESVKEADIFYRYGSRTERIKYPELKILLEEVRNREKREWSTLLQKITERKPSETAVVDLSKGTLSGGEGQTILIDESLIKKISFIKEGRLSASGRPTLRLIGDVSPAPSSVAKEVRVTGDRSAPLVRLAEADMRYKYPWDYKTLVKELSSRYDDFKQNAKFNDLKGRLVAGGDYTWRRRLDETNPKSAYKDFYSREILEAFDKHYQKKKKGL